MIPKTHEGGLQWQAKRYLTRSGTDMSSPKSTGRRCSMSTGISLHDGSFLAFNGCGKRGLEVRRPDQSFATPDHYTPTHIDIP